MNNVLVIVNGQLALIRAYMEAVTELYVDSPNQSNMYRFLAEQTWDDTRVLLDIVKRTYPDEFKDYSSQLQDIILNLDLEFE